MKKLHLNLLTLALVLFAVVGISTPREAQALYEPTKQATCPVGATNVTIGGYTYCSFDIGRASLPWDTSYEGTLHNAQLICRYVNPYAIVTSVPTPVPYDSPDDNYLVYVDQNTGEFKRVWAASTVNSNVNISVAYAWIRCGIPTVAPAQQVRVAIDSQYDDVSIQRGDTISNIIQGNLTLGTTATPATLSLVSIRNPRGDNLVGSSTQNSFIVNPTGYFTVNPLSVTAAGNALSTISITTTPSIQPGTYSVTVGANYTTASGINYTPYYHCFVDIDDVTLPSGENVPGEAGFRADWQISCDVQSALANAALANSNYVRLGMGFRGNAFGFSESQARTLALYEVAYARTVLANQFCGLGMWTMDTGFTCNYSNALSTQTTFDFLVDDFSLAVGPSCDANLAEMTFNRIAGATSYRIYKRQEGTVTTLISTVIDPGAGTQVMTTASSTLSGGSAPGTPIYYQVKAVIGGIESASSREFTYLGAGTTKPNAQCLSCTLGASPNPIQAGQSSTLSWSTSNEVGPTACTLRDITGNTVLSSSTTPPGTLSVSPASTRQYGLYCKDSVASGQCTSNVSVTVNPVTPAPSCTSFTATPNTLPPGGGNVNFAWNIANGQGPFSLAFSPASGFPATQAGSGTGNYSRTVTNSTTFLLTITDALSRSATCSNATVTVGVVNPDVPCIPTSDSPVIIPGGATYPPNANGYVFGTNAPTAGNNTFMYNATPSTKCEYRCDTAGGYQSVGRSATGKRCVKTQDFGER
jgi:hypothetical protein